MKEYIKKCDQNNCVNPFHVGTIKDFLENEDDSDSEHNESSTFNGMVYSNKNSFSNQTVNMVSTQQNFTNYMINMPVNYQHNQQANGSIQQNVFNCMTNLDNNSREYSSGNGGTQQYDLNTLIKNPSINFSTEALEMASMATICCSNCGEKRPFSLKESVYVLLRFYMNCNSCQNTTDFGVYSENIGSLKMVINCGVMKKNVRDASVVYEDIKMK